MKQLIFICVVAFALIGSIQAQSEDVDAPSVDIDLGASKEGSRTDDEVVKREEEAIKLDGLNVAQLKEIREKAEKFTFQTEVNRMMKLIINSIMNTIKYIHRTRLEKSGTEASLCRRK